MQAAQLNASDVLTERCNLQPRPHHALRARLLCLRMLPVRNAAAAAATRTLSSEMPVCWYQRVVACARLTVPIVPLKESSQHAGITSGAHCSAEGVFAARGYYLAQD